MEELQNADKSVEEDERLKEIADLLQKYAEGVPLDI